MKPPFRAFLIREPLANGYTDSFSVTAVTVLELDRDRALVLRRCGSEYRRSHEPLASLASSPTRLFDRLEPFLAALAERAPQPAVAVMTEAEAAKTQLHLPPLNHVRNRIP